MNQPDYGTTQVLESASRMDLATLPVVRTARPLRVRLLRSGLLLIIFVAGSVAGYCVGTLQLIERLTQVETPTTGASKNSEKFTEWLLAQWRKDLSLTDEQYPLVEKIVRRHHEAIDRIRQDVQPKFARELANMDRDMRTVLDDSQKVLWAKRMEWAKNHRYRSPSGGSSKDGGKFRPPGMRPPGDWSRDRPESDRNDPKATGPDKSAPSDPSVKAAPPDRAAPEKVIPAEAN